MSVHLATGDRPTFQWPYSPPGPLQPRAVWGILYYMTPARDPKQRLGFWLCLQKKEGKRSQIYENIKTGSLLSWDPIWHLKSILIIYGDHMMMVYDYLMWWSYMIIIIESMHRMNVSDDHIWCSYMMIIYDHHIWWSYMMIVYDHHI